MSEDIRKMKNVELYEKYNGHRGGIASEMCRRAGTIEYLLKFATFDDRAFFSCMRDTIDVFKTFLLKEERKLKTF